MDVTVNDARQNQGAFEVNPLFVACGGDRSGGEDLFEPPVGNNQLHGLGFVAFGRYSQIEISCQHLRTSLARSNGLFAQQPGGIGLHQGKLGH